MIGAIYPDWEFERLPVPYMSIDDLPCDSDKLHVRTIGRPAVYAAA